MSDESEERESTYTPLPKVPAEIAAKYEAVLSVLSGRTSVSEAARNLGMSRNHFQTLMHRGLEGMLESLSPKAPGRPATPATEAALAKENARLARENAKLSKQVGTTTQLFELAANMLKGRARGKNTKTKGSAESAEGDKSEDPPPGTAAWRTWLFDGFRKLQELGMTATLAAAVAGHSPATMWRWEKLIVSGAALPDRRRYDRKKLPSPEVFTLAAQHAVELRGQVGAESLRQTFPDLSRRNAEAVLKAVRTSLERNRKLQAALVFVTRPGVLRSFDSMEIPTPTGKRYLLVCADGKIPFRTTVTVVEHYTGEAVAALLARDFELNGAPYVLRMDRASMHGTPEVIAVLEKYGVLVLHGHPNNPLFYAQLERMNREHRGYAETLGAIELLDLPAEGIRMVNALNGKWRRRTLGWMTAAEVWQRSSPVAIDRGQLRKEVEDRTERIRAEMDLHGKPADQAERFAIEAALKQRGLLFVQERVGC